MRLMWHTSAGSCSVNHAVMSPVVSKHCQPATAANTHPSTSLRQITTYKYATSEGLSHTERERDLPVCEDGLSRSEQQLLVVRNSHRDC